MAITSYDNFISQISNGVHATYPIWDELQSAATTFTTVIVRSGFCTKLPNPLPSGVTGYIPTRVTMLNSNGTLAYMVGWLVNLGNFVVGTGFTGSNTMPSRTELGNSVTLASPVFVEVTTAFASVSGSITLTYVNQDGTGSQTTPSFSISGSQAIRSGGYVPLATGDWGVQSITSISGAPTGTGTLQFWGLVPITIMFSTNQGNADNLLTSMVAPISMPAGYDIGAFSIGTTSTKGTFGTIHIVGNN